MSAPLLLHVFPSFAVGGAQVRFAALANRFGPRWRHVVVALDGETACAARIGPQVSLRLLPAPPHASAPARLWGIARLLAELRPALLVTGNWGSIEWAIANRLGPRVAHLHTEDGFGPGESQRQLPRRVLARRLVLRGSEVVLPSATLRRAAVDLWRLPPARLHLIPNGIDLARFTPDGAAAVFPGAGPLIGTVAALRPEKNLARLLRAVALLHRQGLAPRLLLVGEGPEAPRLRALALELGLGASVIFAGAVADPAACYRAMDIFALSSDTEQMPFSVLEAMATGLPVTSTDVGDVARMLAPEGRALVVPGEDAALAGALARLLGDAALRGRLGAANLARARREFDQETMFAAHAALIDRLVRA